MKSILPSVAYSPLHLDSYSDPSLRYGSFTSKRGGGVDYDVDNDGNVGVIIDGYTTVRLRLLLLPHPPPAGTGPPLSSGDGGGGRLDSISTSSRLVQSSQLIFSFPFSNHLRVQ
jgi:hypothetical protein